MSTLALQGLSKQYGTSIVVAEVNLEVAQGEMIVLLGPSGCGKTTTLRMIAGFVEASRGDILVDGRSILPLPPHKRDLGLVFQSYALFPHMTVARNLAFGLEMRGMKKPAIDARVAEMLRLTRLAPLAGRYPRELSGGQQQRVALGRALAIEPRLLLDEPLSNLDAALRGAVGRDIRLMQKNSGLTTLMVTHDQDEAMAIADRLVVMKEGRVQQVGTQEDVYERPINSFVASFIGHSTMLPGTLRDGRFISGAAVLNLAGAHRWSAGAATLALRPERLSVAAPGLTGPGTVPGTVRLASYLGATREYLVQIAPDIDLIVHDGTGHGGTLPGPGTPVTVRWDTHAERVFDAQDMPLLLDFTPAPTRIASDA